MPKQGSALLIGLNIIGFTLPIIGGGLIRFSGSDIFSIIGGFVLVGDVAILSLTRLIPK